ncbi:GNAT family N-acetyltransferase [Salibacteraceae bacterium]|jgi:ElaA protein|nr:GNAT family N-acetyltransferase [Salibacteraceae bacterium]
MKLEYKLKDFQELSVDELYALLKLRQDVFHLEQDCLYPDLDDLDQTSKHLLQFDGEELIGYGRILWSVEQNLPALGRIVIAPSHRGKSLGRELIDVLNKLCEELHPGKKIYIMAQEHLKALYEEKGYVAFGESFLEDDIPHIHMLRG